jgi:mannose-6-phosphate isomerase-like protein (cupin superfamily)
MQSIVVRASDPQPFDYHGLQISDYTAGAALASSVAVIDVAPQVTHPPAFNRASQKFYFVLAGHVTFEVDDSLVEIGPGDLLVVPVNSPFSYCSKSGSARLLLVHTPPFDSAQEVTISESMA